MGALLLNPILIATAAILFLFGLGILIDVWRPLPFRILCRLCWHDDEQIVDCEKQITYNVCWLCGYTWQDDYQVKLRPGNRIYRDGSHTCKCRRWKRGADPFCQGDHCANA